MHVIAAFLEKHGLISEDRVESYARNSEIPQLFDAYQEFHDSLLSESRRIITEDRHALQPFNFLAGSSLRGDSGCGAWDCRAQKLEILSRYASLYCDRVIVPFAPNLHRTARDYFRFEIANQFLALVKLRPAIEAGAVAVVIPEFHFCDDCMAGMRQAIKSIEKLSARLCRQKSDQFKLWVRGPRREFPPMIEMTGPEDYLEHGQLMALLWETPSWLRKVVPKNSRRRTLAPPPRPEMAQQERLS